MVDLKILVAELHRLAATKDLAVALTAEELSGCVELTALPRYRDGAAGLQRLFADLQSAIEGILDEEVRQIARAHFRIEFGDLQYMARHRALRPDGGEDNTKTRRIAVTTIEPRLAFHLFQRGIEWEEPDEYLDYGFRAIEHDWSLTVDPLDPRRETLRQVVKARCVRPGQRFYVFGVNDEGATRESVCIVSDAPDHVLVGDDGVVGLDRTVVAGDDYLVVVYLGKDYSTDDIMTTGIERVTVKPASATGSSLFITPVGPMNRARLTVYASQQILPHVVLVDRDLSVTWTPTKPDVPVERTNDEPVVFEIDNPEVGHRYEIAWQYHA